MHLFKAGDERLTVTAVVHVLNMHHLESRPGHHVRGIECKVWRQLRCGYLFRSVRMRVAAAFGVSKYIKLELPHACIQLRGKRWMRVLEGGVQLRILLLPQLRLTRRNSCMVAVVRADHLDLIHLHGAGRLHSDDGLTRWCVGVKGSLRRGFRTQR